MKCINRLITLLVSLAAGALPAASAPPPCLAVGGDRIRLKDLAPVLPAGAMDAPERPVGFTPRPGLLRLLSFREWAGSTRRPLPGEPEELCVERLAHPLKSETVTLALQSAYKEWGPQLEIQVLEMPKGPVPEGDLVFPVNRARMARPDPRTGVVLLNGHVVYGDDPDRPLRFPVWVRARVEVPITRMELICPLEAGSELQAECVRTTTAPGYPAQDSLELVSIRALIGRTARRKLVAGAFLRDAHFTPRQDVKPHQEIQLVVRSGQATLHLKATSEGGAIKGGWVMLRVHGARQRLRARVVDEGAAEYILPSSTSPTQPDAVGSGPKGSR